MVLLQQVVGLADYSVIGTQLQNRLKSPYTLSTRPIGGQYLTALSVVSGKAIYGPLNWR
jgi:hypothetical protein